MTKDLTTRVNNLVDLVAKNMGGEVLYVSDDFFASKDNLIQEGRGTWDPDLFNDKGKVYDGWESRRNRSDDNDWVIIKLATRGIISLIDVDTNHFMGNAPQFVSVEGVDTALIERDNIDDIHWQPILSVSSVKPGRQNYFLVDHEIPVTYVRLQIYPDGGVARFRCYGRAIVPKEGNQPLDYASSLVGGKAIVASDMFFGEMSNLLKPSTPKNMGDGWETKRRRGKGHDWVIIELGELVVPEEFVIDTMHFKGNYPDRCSIDVCMAGSTPANELTQEKYWTEIVTSYKLQADREHRISDFDHNSVISHVRLRIYPDGGIARFRVIA